MHTIHKDRKRKKNTAERVTMWNCGYTSIHNCRSKRILYLFAVSRIIYSYIHFKYFFIFSGKIHMWFHISGYVRMLYFTFMDHFIHICDLNVFFFVFFSSTIFSCFYIRITWCRYIPPPYKIYFRLARLDSLNFNITPLMLNTAMHNMVHLGKI